MSPPEYVPGVYQTARGETEKTNERRILIARPEVKEADPQLSRFAVGLAAFFRQLRRELKGQR